MNFPSRYALLVLAPLALSVSGCAGPFRVTKGVVPGGEVSTEQRLLTMARIYEREGQFEKAQKFYGFVLKSNPAQEEARQHSEHLLLALRETQPALPPGTEPAPATTPRPIQHPKAARLIPDSELAARVPKEKPAKLSLGEGTAVVRSSPETAPLRPQQPLAATAKLPVPDLQDNQDRAAKLPTIRAAAPSIRAATPSTLQDAQPGSTAPPIVASGEWRPRGLEHLCPDAKGELLDAVKMLSSDDVEIQKGALEEIVSMGEAAEPAIPALHACLKHGNPVVRAYSAWALWETSADGETATATLKTLLAGDDPDAPVFACYILGMMGFAAEGAIADLAAAQNYPSLVVRAHAAEALLKISEGNSGSVIVLDHILKTGDADERALAVLALSAAKGMDRAAAIDALIGVIDDNSSAVRSSAALTLGSFGTQAARATARLQLAVATSDPETRAAVETALACIRQ